MSCCVIVASARDGLTKAIRLVPPLATSIVYCIVRELKRLNMEAEDQVTKAKDVQMMRVTKELQERLMMSNIQAKDQHQIETLENTIDLNKKVLFL